jgi:hypothetical protein
VSGHRLITLDMVGTAAFVITATLEAAVLTWARPIGVAVALILFTVGCVLFLWGYAVAVQRSRTNEIGVTALYLLTDGVAPKPVKARLLGLLTIQVVAALTTAALRPFTTVAFGILVPMFGLGVNGLWAARHGRFAERARPMVRETE